jgi:cytochrome c peroxidase
LIHLTYTRLIPVCLFLLICVAAGNPSPHPEKVKKLGEKLFHSTILSSDQTISCSSCHKPAFAFADSVAFSRGMNNQLTLRNTPSVMNVADRPYFFHDGRASSLEEQALGPIQNPLEMNLPFGEAIRRLNASKEWLDAFQKVYGHAPDSMSVLSSLAAFERSLETSQSVYDLSRRGKAELSADAEEGRQLFNGKAGCFDCHMGVDFTNDEFRNIGLFNGKNLNDSGRAAITRNQEDLGKFKIPGLRNVAVTAPYMHNGMFKNLDEVIDYYNNPDQFVAHSQNRDSLVHALGLTALEKQQLKKFLESLTDKRFSKK